MVAGCATLFMLLKPDQCFRCGRHDDTRGIACKQVEDDGLLVDPTTEKGGIIGNGGEENRLGSLSGPDRGEQVETDTEIASRHAQSREIQGEGHTGIGIPAPSTGQCGNSGWKVVQVDAECPAHMGQVDGDQ